MMKAEILYEQYRLNELSAEQKKELENDPGLSEKIRELEDSDRDFFSRYPASQMIRNIKAKGKQAKILDFKKSALRFGTPLAAIAALFTVLFLSVPELFKSDDQAGYQYLTGNEDTRIKGIEDPARGFGQRTLQDQPVIRIYRKTGEETVELENNDNATMGDRLQLSYYLPEAKYGAIFSLDGNDVLTLHYPGDGNESVRLEAGREFYLPFAYELDDAPDFEKFLFIYSDEPFSLNEAATAIEEASTRRMEQEIVRLLGKDDNIGVYSINIDKE